MDTLKQGQRWASDAEPDLGLGIVLEIDVRSVSILFPASGETRRYGRSTAPIRRVRFRVGDTVATQDGEEHRITKLAEADGIITYQCEDLQITEAQVADSAGVQGPLEALLAGRIATHSSYALRQNALDHRHDVAASPMRGLQGARIDLIPHQLYIANDVCSRDLPRVMLSDEVGLGKTIEACLILHRLHLLGRADRALILVPDALVHQWFVELMRRFNMRFAIYDEERCVAITDEEAGVNPFLDDQLVLGGVDDMAARPERCEQIVAAGWDLVVIDEAHHLEWSPDGAGESYALVEALAAETPALLLLTATPEQLGPASHFARLRLLDPDRYPSFEAFEEEQDRYGDVAERAAVLHDAGDDDALRDLLDHHGPGRVIFRNTRANMPGFPARIPHIEVLEGEADPATAKTDWLTTFLTANAETKVLLICHGAPEAQAVKDALAERMNVSTALFSEDMTLLQRDRQAAWFAEPEGARLLIATAIGGEGRNFQFVQNLVLFDLPEDPELLEQRIGRLDRIGQKGDIHIHVPVLKAGREAGLAVWYDEALDAFRRPCPAGYDVMRRFVDRLDTVDEALIAETRDYAEHLRDRHAEGRDRLLEWGSWHPREAERVVDAVRAIDEDPRLGSFVAKLMDAFGVNVEPLDAHDLLLSPGPTFTREIVLAPEGLRVTLSRSRSLAREDVILLTWDHPMVSETMERLIGSEQGTVAFASAEGAPDLVLETTYVLECVAPRALGADRFLAPTPLRAAVDWQLEAVERDLPARLSDGDPHRVLDKEVFRTEKIPAMFAEAQVRAEVMAESRRADAVAEMQRSLGGELKRIEALRAVNDHVREEEVEALRARIAQLVGVLGAARVRLDSCRLILSQPGA